MFRLHRTLSPIGPLRRLAFCVNTVAIGASAELDGALSNPLRRPNSALQRHGAERMVLLPDFSTYQSVRLIR